MKLTIRWQRVVAVCLGLGLTVSTLSVSAAEHLVVLVSGEKPETTPSSPARPQVVRDSNQPTTTVVVAADIEPAKKPDESAVPKRVLTDLDKLVDEAVAVTSRRYLTADEHTPWQIFHGLLALRNNFQLKINNEKSSAMKWVQSGPNFRGLPLIEQTAYGGRFHPFTVPYAFEGHPNQFLAILSMAELPRNFAFRAGNGATVTIDDMLRNAQADCNDREEVTWTLWAFARYVHPSVTWTNRFGEQWSMERLVQTEVGKRVQEGACGGCHGLFALALSRNAYLQSGYQLRGAYFEADMKVKRYIAETRAFQNADGSFSSNHYNGPGYAPDFNKRVAASGHILEWLMIGASNEELEQEWLKRGVTSVARDLVENKAAPADCGPLYHALHALVLYRQRTRPELEDPTVVRTVTPPPLANAAPAAITMPMKSDGSGSPKDVFLEPKKVEAKKTEPAKTAALPEVAPPVAPKTVSVPNAKPAPTMPETPTVPQPLPETSTKKLAAPAAPPMPEPMSNAVKRSDETTKLTDKTSSDGEFQVPLPPTDD